MNRLEWSFLLVACACAVGRAVTISPPALAAPASASVQREAFVDVASHEKEMRLEAAKSFPTDPWSQDDAFHDLELKRASSFAREHGVRLGDVLGAIDRGMREGWQDGRIGAPMTATVPPCRPRAIY